MEDYPTRYSVDASAAPSLGAGRLAAFPALSWIPIPAFRAVALEDGGQSTAFDHPDLLGDGDDRSAGLCCRSRRPPNGRRC